MAKSKKVFDLSIPQQSKGEVKNFWCVNCGLYGEFKVARYRKLNCPNCSYDDLCKLDKDDWEEISKRKPEVKRNKF